MRANVVPTNWCGIERKGRFAESVSDFIMETTDLVLECPLLNVAERLSEKSEFQLALSALKSGQIFSFDSVWGSSLGLLAAALGKHVPRMLVVVAEDRDQDNLRDDLETFFKGPINRFPACLSRWESTVALDLEYGDRLRLLKSLTHAHSDRGIIVATVASLLQPVPPQQSIEAHSQKLSIGQELDTRAFQAWMLKEGFHATTAVELPGEFSIRGGIIDLFAPDWSRPVRIELFDTEIESLREFDVASQISQADLKEIEITVLSPEFKEKGSLSQYLPPQTLILQYEPLRLRETAKHYLERSERPERLFSWEELNQQWASFPMASADAVAAGYLGHCWQLPIDSIDIQSNDLGELKLRFERLALNLDGSPCDVHLLARVPGELPRIREILDDTVVAQAGRLHYGVGNLHSGFRLRDDGIVMIGSDQLFHRTDLRRSSNRQRLSKPIDSFIDLQEGNLVVHLAHGIARFLGMVTLEKDGQLTEHLLLEFYGGAKMYVPASKIDLVQKYIGGSKTKPVLAKLGNKIWGKKKQAVEAAVMDLAAEMIELQAEREIQGGIAFNHDSDWQCEFEQSFPFSETPDQLTAIEAIKDDMHRTVPMDRLLCGDVGFGKTEVAMRAAFKAIQSGYQVAVLVPTTVLAEQHFKSFKERMSEFPVSIAKLSRFCSRREIKETLQKLKTGEVDIAIGTHRIVSKDVKFNRLGLVIVDEEQRFGVEHKERLKKLKSNVDLLTLSATPIPRTLHMSLVGVRNISNLQTAPADRTRVETKVLRYNHELIRSAIIRELNRGGQVFFLHNRVSSIFAIADELKSLVPEASFVVGHGQMDEQMLESAMTDFINHRFDVLVATTIIESGLDIPNANTIFINDADRFGLSDLHQLRGRVGRFKHQAYCYLLLDPKRSLSPTASRRLQAIETFSDMGAGFQISMRDLEIRGAGNLLGTEQSGHIAAVGYELYCQMLETAVRKLKHQPQKMTSQVEVDLPLSAYLPDEYVSDKRQKIDLYRRLSRAEDFKQIQEIATELRDRFGPVPAAATRLLALSELKLEATLWQLNAIFLQSKFLMFKFNDRARITQLAKHKPMIRIIDDQTAAVTLKSVNFTPEKLLSLVKSLLQING